MHRARYRYRSCNLCTTAGSQVPRLQPTRIRRRLNLWTLDFWIQYRKV
ncbi:Protein of unknown function [Pyronema omphalodes CBS 100304]|uniref:Uncharacterized protein n=1 Tax=Pyronema omphalodes (strain CBS 100304) TaxID=1076935 RepID=U4LUT7_PYROM|nr:Protein of unknown function [Pyronema omphalodes CBS 100304]